MKEAIQLLNSLAGTGFWGNVQIDFQHGQVTVIRKNETIKVEENNRYGYRKE